MTKIILATIILIVASSSALSSEDSAVEFRNPNRDDTSNLPFSEAVKVGNTLYLSGQLGFDAKAGKLVAGGIVEESKKALENIKAVLKSNGYAMSDVVKCTVMLADIAEWSTFNEVYVTYFAKPYPARSAFAASGLALNARVEVECMAAK